MLSGPTVVAATTAPPAAAITKPAAPTKLRLFMVSPLNEPRCGPLRQQSLVMALLRLARECRQRNHEILRLVRFVAGEACLDVLVRFRVGLAVGGEGRIHPVSIAPFLGHRSGRASAL